MEPLSTRYRVLRKAGRVLKPKGGTLQPNQMRLYSSYFPALPGGDYTIQAEQSISTADGSQSLTRSLSSPQIFKVVSPRFSLPPNIVHSTFPPQGLSSQSNILPHIVFNDPHLPWQVMMPGWIPWLALLVFEQSELELSATASVFSSTLPSAKRKQSPTMSVRLTLKELSHSICVPQPVVSNDPENLEVDVIFLKRELFTKLFVSSSQICLDRYKYLAHVREVNTTNMSNSGALEEGMFSVVFSHRTGPLFPSAELANPKPCAVHLVSLEGVKNMPLSTNADRFALVSLFSWTYDCLPAKAINFVDVMRQIGLNKGVFRTSQTVLDEAKANFSTLGLDTKRILSRLEDGYTLLRYRTQTGEQTVALTRGPLIPGMLDPSTSQSVHSNYGTDLQIFDSFLGMIDISYCAAWQLGKALAIADQAFAAALSRLRADIHSYATKSTKAEILATPGTWDQVKGSLGETLTKLKSVQTGQDVANQNLRWQRPSLQNFFQPLLGYDATLSSLLYAKHTAARIKTLSGHTNGAFYNEFNSPNSHDWALVLKWILDKMYLENVPPHYLIPDPTFLPEESIRFFHIDRKWVNAFVDGALSIGNHFHKVDVIRQGIKLRIQTYLQSQLDPTLPHLPQIPKYGFFVRSVAVSAFPDMVVRVPWPDVGGLPDKRAEVLRMENLREDVLFCLLDRTPDDPCLVDVAISQPPHQQCFAFGRYQKLTQASVEIELKKVFIELPGDAMGQLLTSPVTLYPTDENLMYDWHSRTIVLDKFAAFVLRKLKESGIAGIYNQSTATSALLGIQLNEPIYQLRFVSAAVPRGNAATAALAFPESPQTTTLFRPSQAVPQETNTPSILLSDSSPSPTSPKALQSPSGARNTIVWPPNMADVASNFAPLCFACGDLPSSEPADKLIPAYQYGTDLVIRLSRKGPPFSTDLPLREVQVKIPCGSEPDRLIKSVLPTQPLQARMVGNIRWNVVLDVDDNAISIRLVPRSDARSFSLSVNTDLSFVINEVPINRVAARVTITVWEKYQGPASDVMATSHIRNVQARIPILPRMMSETFLDEEDDFLTEPNRPPDRIPILPRRNVRNFPRRGI